ncbi:MAG: peptide chain release factor N(5)-glutamine methyltransferase [bacterium]|nr:peptide chain release factor N(5)-glutamine methyltransferase [bacterium]
MDIQSALTTGAELLPRRIGILDPPREAVWLLAAAWGRSETWIRARSDAFLPDEVEHRYIEWIDKRRAGVPAHYLKGECSFWGRDFGVSPAVLIPRPESELLIEVALELGIGPRARVLDVGTGSGCLAVTLAVERPRWTVFAIDQSMAALQVARLNGERWNAAVHFSAGDLIGAVTGGFELITANLPYIPEDLLAGLSVEVQHEPRLALDGGPDGLCIVSRLLRDLVRILKPCGGAILELGEDQVEPVITLARDQGLAVARRVRDIGGCDRIVVLQPI